MKRFWVVLICLGLGRTAWGQSAVGEVVDELAIEAADAVAEAITDQGRVFLTGISLNEAPTPLGDLFSLKAANRVLSRSRGRVLVVVEEETADYVLSGRAFELEDEVLFGFTLVRTNDKTMVGGFDRTYDATRELRQKLRPAVAGGDDWEPNDSSADAVQLEVGESIAGLTLLPANDNDWFRLDLGPEVSLVLETRGELDTYMEVYGPDNPGIFYAENDDGVDANAQVFLSADATATFWVKIRGYDSSVIGSYTLVSSTDAASPDPFEPNDEQSLATDLRPGDEQEHSLVPSGDIDWYRIELPAGQDTFLLTLQTFGGVDTYMTLYSQNGDVLAEDDDSGADGSNALIDRVLRGQEVVFASVEGYSGSFGAYTIVANVDRAILDDFEPDDSFASAVPLPTDGSPQRHTFTSGSDEDYLVFQIQSGAFVVVETEGDIDTYMVLYDDDQNVISEDDDGGSDYNARVSSELPPGRYYVVVTQLDDRSQAEYTVKLQRYNR